MISRKHRFHGLGSLRPIYKNAQTTRAPDISVKAILNPRRRSYRCAVVVSKKVSKSAVVRNRIRRRIYNVIQELEPKITSAYDIIISVHDVKVATEPAQELVDTIYKLFAQARVLS